ncbi:hypothetical protein K2173_024492 [Erythroxylum novogranatense]|uniref:RING-type E3 ubiquitin transferase n=1 Tax=Erythroxylum novogranatense TaxID=1862640 RepID=A0AAV8SUG4_9ROSI|nr:hypothetical protein K2173_024492 [Erythroxylum novogranatense]
MSSSSSSSYSAYSPPSIVAINDNNGHHMNTAPFEGLKPSILIILLILSVTVLLSVTLCLLLRLLNHRCLRHLSPSSISLPTSTTTTSSSNRHSHRVSPDTPQSSFLDALPLFTFSSIKRRSSSSEADCAVCLSKFEPQDQLRLLPLCCHAFHAACIDIWLQSNHTCPLCRSSIQVSDSNILSSLSNNNDSFRLEIGSISRRRQGVPDSAPDSRASYSLGSFDYVVEEESEIYTDHTQQQRSVLDKDTGTEATQQEQQANLASDVSSGRSWLKEYVDRLSNSLSSRAFSFRSSGRFFTGSSRRTEIGSAVAGVECDLDDNRIGEEISELFRWFSGV